MRIVVVVVVVVVEFIILIGKALQTVRYQEYITPRVCNSSYGVCVTLRRQNFTSRDEPVHSVHDRYWVVRSPALGTTLLWSLCTVCQHKLSNHVT